MRTFLSNIVNDLSLASDGNLAVGNTLAFRAQTYAQYMQARRGEMIHEMQRGIPYDDVVWSGTPNVAQFEAAARSTLLQVAGTVEILAFSATLSDNVLSYTADILTDAGMVTING